MTNLEGTLSQLKKALRNDTRYSQVEQAVYSKNDRETERLLRKYLYKSEAEQFLNKLNLDRDPQDDHYQKSSSFYSDQKQLNKPANIMHVIRQELNNIDVFSEVDSLIKRGKLNKVQDILKDELGKNRSKNLMKKIKQNFTEKKNEPDRNSKLLRQGQDGIKFYQLKTQDYFSENQQIINVLIVGMTGVGKSTFLNSLVNYLYEVDGDDDFRYIISRDMFNNFSGKSSTTEVKIYGIPKKGKMKKSYRLIDIPGIGDTEGFQKDQKNLKMIKESIQNSLTHINQIIYIFKASDTRVTKQSEYAISQIMGMFAKDVESNITFVLTFADNNQPKVLSHLKIIFKELIEKISAVNPQWSLKVNNSALLKKISRTDEMDMAFYKMGQHCLEKVFNVIQNSTQVNIANIVKVMGYRQELKTSIKALDQAIASSIEKQESIKKLIKDLTICQEVASKLDHKEIFKEQIIKQTIVNKNVTSCIECKLSCHINCYGKNQEKIECIAIQKNGFCEICPKECLSFWSCE